MNLLIICPIPVEFNACRQVLGLRDTRLIKGFRTGRSSIGNTEITAIESGPAKVRAACAAAAGCHEISPDVVLDSGSCAGIEPGALIGEIIVGGNSFEYDISGNGIPRKRIPEMELPSGFSFLQPGARNALHREAVDRGKMGGYPIRIGIQACGEYLIHSIRMREILYNLFHAAGSNWETAGIFIACLKNMLPPLSFRIITDLGDEQALHDYRKNIKQKARELYQYIHELIETGWFGAFKSEWQQVDKSVINSLPQSVKP